MKESFKGMQTAGSAACLYAAKRKNSSDLKKCGGFVSWKQMLYIAADLMEVVQISLIITLYRQRLRYVGSEIYIK